MKVYIVDDEPKVRNGLCAAVHAHKPAWPMPLTAPSADAAWQDARLRETDILLVDVRMPGMTGLELLDKLMEAVPERDIQAVVVSGYAEFEYARAALRMGARDYLLKPVDLDKLFALLDQLEERAERARREDAELDAQPDIPAEKSLSEVEKRLPQANPIVRQAARYVREHPGAPLKVEEIAALLFVHANYLSELFKKETGVNLSAYVQDNKILLAKRMLADPANKVYMVASECGFASQHYFCHVFRKHTGMTPKQYRAACVPPPAGGDGAQ